MEEIMLVWYEGITAVSIPGEGIGRPPPRQDVGQGWVGQHKIAATTIKCMHGKNLRGGTDDME